MKPASEEDAEILFPWKTSTFQGADFILYFHDDILLGAFSSRDNNIVGFDTLENAKNFHEELKQSQKDYEERKAKWPKF